MVRIYCVDRRTISADFSAECLDSFDACADDWERETFNRLRRDDLRSAYRLSHGALRLALKTAMASDKNPASIQRMPSGKPFLPGGPQFNMSHAGDLTVIALSPATPVGIDVEPLGSASEDPTPLTIVMAEGDRDLLPELSDIACEAEIMLWTIKEAALKLTGDVMLPPESISVKRRSNTFEVTASAERDTGRPAFVHFLPLADDHVAALATFEPEQGFEIMNW